MKYRSKLFTCIAASMVCLAAWEARPLPPQVQHVTKEGVHYRVEKKRKITFLPVNKWGIGKSEMYGCGFGVLSGGFTEQYRKLGFVSVLDTEQTTVVSPAHRQKATAKPDYVLIVTVPDSAVNKVCTALEKAGSVYQGGGFGMAGFRVLKHDTVRAKEVLKADAQARRYKISFAGKHGE